MMHDNTGERPSWALVEGPGDGSPVMLISGLGGTAPFWDEVQSRLAARFRVLAYDQPGCGRRPAEEGPVSIDRLAQDAASLAEDAFGPRPLTVIGHSTGGAIAQALAAMHPDRVSALVLSGTWLRADAYMRALFGYRSRMLEEAPDLASGLTTLLTRATGDIDEDALSPVPLTARAVAVARARIAALLDFDGTELAGKVDCRSLVLGAEDDRIVPPGLQRTLHHALPESTLHMLPDGGHFFPRTRAPAMVQCVEDWLADGDPTAAPDPDPIEA